MPPHRVERVTEELRTNLSEILQFEMKDPRIPTILTITRVDLSRDLRNATVFFSQLKDDDDSLARTQEALTGAAGFLQSELARRMRLQFQPRLVFRADHGQRNYFAVDRALKAAKEPPKKPDGPKE